VIRVIVMAIQLLIMLTTVLAPLILIRMMLMVMDKVMFVTMTQIQIVMASLTIVTIALYFHQQITIIGMEIYMEMHVITVFILPTMIK
jgi:hypothetical protein